MLLPFLVACCSGAVVLASQHPLSPPPLQFDNSSAPFIFNSLSSLLVQWPNTYHGNGHTVIPGILEPYTLLYHARKDTASPPPSPEWFAFDPEMSYGIMAGRRGQTFLHTYRNIRPARIVYFDGMSAALNQMGWLDSQEILFNNGSDRSDGYPSLNEYDRARKLCAWGQEFGVEGFVRMNAGFHLNITAPGTPPGSSDMPPGPPPGSGRPVPPTGPPGRDAPTRGRRGGMGGWSPFGMTGFSEWLRAASQRGTVPQPHILLDYASLVTFYHPRLRSLAQTREGQPMRQHRIWTNISDADAQSVVDEIEDVLGRPPWRRVGSGMDWGALTRNVVEEWASRVVQLHEFLGNASAELDSGASVNTTATLQFVRRLTYSPLNPFMDTGASSNSTAWDWFGSLIPATSFPATAAASGGRRECERFAPLYGHEKKSSKGSNASIPTRNKSLHSSGAVFFSSPAQIGRLIENLSRGADAGSFNIAPEQGRAQFGHSTSSSFGSETDMRWFDESANLSVMICDPFML
ncbi:predicted protein [Postia placenta Mad-698-R]|nr:predicted protein [Postia placenta Mad-698-R]